MIKKLQTEKMCLIRTLTWGIPAFPVPLPLPLGCAYGQTRPLQNCKLLRPVIGNYIIIVIIIITIMVYLFIYFVYVRLFILLFK